MDKISYPGDIDAVWLASDKEGAVAAFVTAGMGPIPRLVIESGYLRNVKVEGLIAALPEMAEAIMMKTFARPDDYIAMASRGLFVYDWSDIHRTTAEESGMYELVAQPTRPLSASTLPRLLAVLAEMIVLSIEGGFGPAAIDVTAMAPCMQPVIVV